MKIAKVRKKVMICREGGDVRLNNGDYIRGLLEVIEEWQPSVARQQKFPLKTVKHGHINV